MERGRRGARACWWGTYGLLRFCFNAAELTSYGKRRQGAYAEYIVVQQTHIAKKPTHLSWAEAASIPENFLTGTYTNALI